MATAKLASRSKAVAFTTLPLMAMAAPGEMFASIHLCRNRRVQPNHIERRRRHDFAHQRELTRPIRLSR